MKHGARLRAGLLLQLALAFLAPAIATPTISLGVRAQPASSSLAAPPAAASTPAAVTVYRSADSPRAALSLYFDATRQGRWDEAARYLALGEAQQPHAARLARRLKGVIDGHHWIDLDTVSALPQGRLDDGLPPDYEDVDRFAVNGREESVRMVRLDGPGGGRWAFSAETVGRIDAWYGQLPDRWVRDFIVYTGLDTVLLLPGPFELLWWQWVALPIIALLSLLFGSVLGRLSRAGLLRLVAQTSHVWDSRAIARIGAPLTLAWALNLFWFSARGLSLTDPAYRALDSFATAGMVFVLFWALWRSSGAIATQMMLKPWAVRSPSARTFVTVGSNFARSAIFCIGGLAVLGAAGYPVGTLLAGLGIGGLAIAFGAQKTIENIFGSLSIVIDQPFRVGDLVRVDDVVGTVEDIGLRSTRFRTADRTVVSIPNGKLADQKLESYEARDRMRLMTTLAVEYGTTRTQLKTALDGLEQVLRSHPKIWPDSVTVKFTKFAESALEIEVVAWFQVPTWAEFQDCRQEVLLACMQVVEEAGVGFAFPTRTVHLASKERGRSGV